MCVAPTPSPGPVGLLGFNPPAVYQVQLSEVLEPLCREPVLGSFAAPPSSGSSHKQDESTLGSAAVGTGIGSMTRIPVPGTNGLFVELSPRGWKPSGGTTSTLFIQDVTGRRHLRLDFGYNKTTKGIDYHWNQSGTHSEFGITDHTPAGRGGATFYRGARYFRYGGRVLLVVGLAVDIYSIVVAKKRWRQAARVVAGWAGAAAGCKIVGAGGAAAGTFIEPGGGTAVGAFAGCVVGGIGGYAGASWVAGQAYDWVEETFFEPVPEVSGGE